MGAQHLLLTFLCSLGLSLVFLPILIRYSARIGLMDNPAAVPRKIHSTSMPRGGGLAFILSAGLALLITMPPDRPLFSFLLSCVVITGFGLLDDFVQLSPFKKLAGQAIGVAIAMAGGMVMIDFPLWENAPAWFAYVITFVFVMGIINGVNFSDGMDGLAAGLTLMGLLLIVVLSLMSSNTQIAAIALAVAAALLGFLRFNTHPAKIFMGDSGSQFLGFVLAWLAISLSQSGASNISTFLPLLILGIPVMDILQVVPVRIYKQLPLPGPDNEHLHHHIAKLAFRQDEVVAIMYLLQAILLAGAYVLRYSEDVVILYFYAVYVLLVLGPIYVAVVNGWRVRAPQVDGGSRRNRLFRRLGEFHPYTGRFFGISVLLYLAMAATLSRSLPKEIMYLAVIWGALLIVVTLVSRNRWPIVLGRLATYTTVGLLTYGMAISVTGQLVNGLIDGALALLGVALAFAIRITRSYYFGLTTHDLLLFLVVFAVAPLLPNQMSEGFPIVSLIFRTWILLYICEFVLARGGRAPQRLTYVSIIALLLTGLNVS